MALSFQEQVNQGLVSSSKTHIYCDVGITGTILNPRTAVALCTTDSPDPLGLIPPGDVRCSSGKYLGYTQAGIQKRPGLGLTGDQVGGYPLISNPRVDSAQPGVYATLQLSGLHGVRELVTQGPGYGSGSSWRSSGLDYRKHNLCLVRMDHNPLVRYAKITLYPVGVFLPTDDTEQPGPETCQLQFVVCRGTQPNSTCPWDLGPEGKVWWTVNIDSMTESPDPGPGNDPVTLVDPQFSQWIETLAGMGHL